MMQQITDIALGLLVTGLFNVITIAYITGKIEELVTRWSVALWRNLTRKLDVNEPAED
jgi:hypothetical protein